MEDQPSVLTDEEIQRVLDRTGPERPKDRLLRNKEAARILGYSPRTLDDMRYRKRGPKHVRLPGGRIRYWEGDLKEWLQAHKGIEDQYGREMDEIASMVASW